MVESGKGSTTMKVPTQSNVSKISFGVMKRVEQKIETKLVLATAESDSEEEGVSEAKKRKLTHLENGLLPDDEEDEKCKKDKHSMIIPMVIESDWRVAKLKELEKEGKLTDEDQAKLAILTELQPFKFEEQGKTIVVDDDGKKETEDANYSEVPIESFGLAILRGCGWKDGQGIGKKPQVVPLRLPARRPKGLGLGAKPPKVEKKKGQTTKEENETSGEIVKGSLVKITAKPNAGFYGVVEARDDDNASCFVKLALKQQTVRASLYALEKVSKKEYERDAKCLNKTEYDREKEKIEQIKEEKYGKKGEKRIKEEVKSESQEEAPLRKIASQELWVRVDLIVRLVNEDYKNGRYLSQKMRVLDVADRTNLTLEDEQGKQHYNIRQSWVETVIPRMEGEKVMIVRGSGRGLPAVMEAKDKKREMVVARIIHSDEVFKVAFDDVCMYKPAKHYDSDE